MTTVEEPKTINLVSEEKESIPVDRAMLRDQSTVLRTVLQQDPTATEIPIPAKTRILRLVDKFMRLHPDAPHPPLPGPLHGTDLRTSGATPEDVAFINDVANNLDDLYALAEVANRWGFDELLSLATAQIARLILLNQSTDPVKALLLPKRALPEGFEGARKNETLRDYATRILPAVTALSPGVVKTVVSFIPFSSQVFLTSYSVFVIDPTTRQVCSGGANRAGWLGRGAEGNDPSAMELIPSLTGKNIVDILPTQTYHRQLPTVVFESYYTSSWGMMDPSSCVGAVGTVNSSACTLMRRGKLLPSSL